MVPATAVGSRRVRRARRSRRETPATLPADDRRSIPAVRDRWSAHTPRARVPRVGWALWVRPGIRRAPPPRWPSRSGTTPAIQGASSMGWLLLESALAFLILVAIVAWTAAPSWRRRRRPPAKKD